MDWQTEDFGNPSYLKRLGLTLAKNKNGEITRRNRASDTAERTIAQADRSFEPSLRLC
jgi:hypothetical protein